MCLKLYFLCWIEKFNFTDVSKSLHPETSSVSSWSLVSGNCEPQESITRENSIVAVSISNSNGNVRWCSHCVISLCTPVDTCSCGCMFCFWVTCWYRNLTERLEMCVRFAIIMCISGCRWSLGWWLDLLTIIHTAHDYK